MAESATEVQPPARPIASLSMTWVPFDCYALIRGQGNMELMTDIQACASREASGRGLQYDCGDSNHSLGRSLRRRALGFATVILVIINPNEH